MQRYSKPFTKQSERPLKALHAAQRVLGSTDLHRYRSHHNCLGFTSSSQHWHYLNSVDLPQTGEIMSALVGMRLPLTFHQDDCRQLASLISKSTDQIATATPA